MDKKYQRKEKWGVGREVRKNQHCTWPTRVKRSSLLLSPLPLSPHKALCLNDEIIGPPLFPSFFPQFVKSEKRANCFLAPLPPSTETGGRTLKSPGKLRNVPYFTFAEM